MTRDELLLLRYSEWLDADQGLIGPGDEDYRTHEDLVQEFLHGEGGPGK